MMNEWMNEWRNEWIRINVCGCWVLRGGLSPPAGLLLIWHPRGVWWPVPKSDFILLPACERAVAVVLHVRHPAARSPHHLQRLGVQAACDVQPKEALHVGQLRGEGGVAALGAAQGLPLKVVKALEVRLRGCWEGEKQRSYKSEFSTSYYL